MDPFMTEYQHHLTERIGTSLDQQHTDNSRDLLNKYLSQSKQHTNRVHHSTPLSITQKQNKKS
jgi:hypothetical protein